MYLLHCFDTFGWTASEARSHYSKMPAPYGLQGCYSQKFVRQFLCVNFAYADSYVHIAIHTTFLRTKNRKFVRKYTHGVSCRTTENFRIDSELMKLPRCLVLESQ